ncbi:oxidoreductase domain protein [Liquorilactobacillus aquaticus DSM 21051]|uniref:Oxidoreductase domain protein n=1 Tax=Liquorilactobacillus aquaticus DSM 21051 TaxID=1423725 RepID=A0A0R2D0D9_9LACO|nr:Gfo/Idh/MocA family oxidoreductase [Liquorilactobacillus aquaticus]KRM97440.1 oxidoreductase domain protein [Liquorilactobacillus aquaticus DSM 21051]
MTGKKLNVGIIGCGKIAQTRHIPEYAHNTHVQLEGYFDYSQERASTMAKQYGGRAFDSIESLLADDKIDAVSICVANESHAKLTIQALKAGKHVLCEKPMATTLEDCEAMIDEAKKAGRKLMIDQNQRLARAHVIAKKLLQQNTIGSVLTFKTTFGHGGPETWSVDPGANTWFFDKNKAKFGAIFDLGVHKLDLMLYLLDSHVTSAFSILATLDKRDSAGELIGVDDNAFSIYKLNSGVLGTVAASWTYYGEEDNSTILYGTKGIMKIYDDPEYAIRVILKNKEHIDYSLDQIQTNDQQTSSGMIDEFVDSILSKRVSISDGETVLNAMKATFAGIESNEKGQMIEIN